MHFTTTQKLDTSEDSYIQLPNGTRFKPSGIQRWLEIWFERKLTWKYLIETKARTPIRLIMRISRPGNIERALGQSAFKQPY
jgi:hypothetical protein